MKDFPELKFVVHCFNRPRPAECDAWLALGAYIGITGIVTYKNAQDVRDSAKRVPADRLLVETDAPVSVSRAGAEGEGERAGVCGAHRKIPRRAARRLPQRNSKRQTTENAGRFYGDRIIRFETNQGSV